MLREATVAAVALAGHMAVQAYSLQKRDGAHGAAAPASGYGAPAPASSYGAPAPASSYSAPASGYSAPASGYGAPAAAPASGYGAPAAAPAASYGAPAAAPAASYSAPATGYGAPATGYGAPSTGYDEPAGYGAESAPSGGGGGVPDLTPIIVGILALIGLSLLFPTFVSITGRRKKRHAIDEDVGPMTNMVERVQDIYSSVLQSESCMERIACELGGVVGDVGLLSHARLAEPLIPQRYMGYYKSFKNGKDCKKIKCGSLNF